MSLIKTTYECTLVSDIGDYPKYVDGVWYYLDSGPYDTPAECAANCSTSATISSSSTSSSSTSTSMSSSSSLSSSSTSNSSSSSSFSQSSSSSSSGYAYDSVVLRLYIKTGSNQGYAKDLRHTLNHVENDWNTSTFNPASQPSIITADIEVKNMASIYSQYTFVDYDITDIVNIYGHNVAFMLETDDDGSWYDRWFFSKETENRKYWPKLIINQVVWYACDDLYATSTVKTDAEQLLVDENNRLYVRFSNNSSSSSSISTSSTSVSTSSSTSFSSSSISTSSESVSLSSSSVSNSSSTSNSSVSNSSSTSLSNSSTSNSSTSSASYYAYVDCDTDCVEMGTIIEGVANSLDDAVTLVTFAGDGDDPADHYEPCNNGFYIYSEGGLWYYKVWGCGRTSSSSSSSTSNSSSSTSLSSSSVSSSTSNSSSSSNSVSSSSSSTSLSSSSTSYSSSSTSLSSSSVSASSTSVSSSSTIPDITVLCPGDGCTQHEKVEEGTAYTRDQALAACMITNVDDGDCFWPEYEACDKSYYIWWDCLGELWRYRVYACCELAETSSSSSSSSTSLSSSSVSASSISSSTSLSSISSSNSTSSTSTVPNMLQVYCCSDDSILGYTDDSIGTNQVLADDTTMQCIYTTTSTSTQGNYFDYSLYCMVPIMGCDDEMGPSYCDDGCTPY